MKKLLKHNLQFFAEGGDPVSGEEGDATETKTFTQKDVDDLIKKRLDRASKGIPTKEELKAFKEWQTSQNPGEDDQGEDAETEDQGDVQDHEEQKEADKVTQLEQRIKQMELDHALDYVIKESGAKSAKLLKAVLDMNKIYCVNGNLSGFDEQLETVKEEYSYLFKDENKGTWGTRQKGQSKKSNGVEGAFLKRNPGLKID